jgi:hypothetical protein
MNISDDINSESIIRAASENFGGDSFKYISSATMNKKAGIPIPDNIKEEARKALEGFKKSAEMIDVILDAIEKNNTLRRYELSKFDISARQASLEERESYFLNFLSV